MVQGGHCGEARAGGRAGGMGGARRDRAALAAERREWAQRGGAIPTCAGQERAVAGIDTEICPKDAEQEEWRDACRRRECRRQEGLLLAQAESEGRWWAVSVGLGRGRRVRGWRGGGSGAAGGARQSRRAREDEGNWGSRRTCLGGDETQ